MGVCIFRCVLLLGAHFFYFRITLRNSPCKFREIYKDCCEDKKRRQENEITAALDTDIFDWRTLADCIIGKIFDKKIRSELIMLDKKKIGDKI